ncbi:MAG: hypothetical protein AAFZ63_08325 [Bacteroidota bacterium]
MYYTTLKAGVNINNTSFFYLMGQTLQERTKVSGSWIGFTDHGSPPEAQLKIYDNLTALNNERIFTIAVGGDLWEFNIAANAWINHRQPADGVSCELCGAAMWDNTIFVIGSDDNLYRHFEDNGTWNWENVGRPLTASGFSVKVGFRPDTPPYTLFDGKLFVIGKRNNLWELFLDNNDWTWVNHGKPRSPYSVTSPGGLTGGLIGGIGGAVAGAIIGGSIGGPLGALIGGVIGAIVGGAAGSAAGHYANGGRSNVQKLGAGMNGEKLFVASRDNFLNEFYWNGSEWQWVRHDKLFRKEAWPSHLETLRNGKLFVSLLNKETLAEHHYTGGAWRSFIHLQPEVGLTKYKVVSGPSEVFINEDRIFVLLLLDGTFGNPAYVGSLSWNGSGWVWTIH